MSVYTQEVLGLLKRNKKKVKLDKIKDYFEFGKLYRNSTLNTGAVYNPTMEPFVIKWGDFKCATEEGMVRQDPTGTQERYITMWTDPVFQGDCNTATITKTIISQNDLGTIINIAGDTVIEGDLQVDQNANINLQLTAGSANILDLTEDRIVIVGPNGELEDDANLTFDGTEFNIGQGNFTVQVNTGNTQIIGTLDVDDQATLASANVEDLTDDRIVIVGVDGELEDDANFTMDGTTFTANVNVIHGTDVPAGVPTHTTTINSNLKLEGPVYDSLGSVGGLNKVLVGLADGRVKWQDDDLVEALTYGSLWQGDPTNYKVELPIGTVDQILISDGVTFSWQDNPAAIVGEACDVYRLPLWTPDSNTLGCSILIQDGNSTTPATKVTIEGEAIVEGDLHVETNTFLEGNVEVNGTTKLDTLAQDDTLVQVLVRDVANDNLIKFRDASSIKPQVGFDTLDMLPDGWASTDGNFNAYVKLDDTTTAVKNIKDMDWLVDGDRVVVIAENIKTGSLLADNAIRFPSWQYPGGSGRAVINFGSWNSPSSPAGPDLGYPTSELRFGDRVKFTAEMYDEPGSLNSQINWCTCVIFANNGCPVATSDSYTIAEDGGTLTATAQATDDGYGSYGLTYTALTQPGNGTFTFDTATGAWTYTPDANYFGVEQFTFQANDGYCDSNIATITINVTAVNDTPEWTSTDPVTDNVYPNLTAGDAWTYNWTTADPDTPCADLTYTITVEDVTAGTVYTLPDANQWLTFTPDPANNCGGTLSGTYPSTGGAWTVNMTVSDNSNPTPLSDTQNFTIAGIVPTIDTYFVNWFDASGSLNGAGSVLSQASSIGFVRATNASAVNGNTVNIGAGNSQGSSNNGQFNNDMSDLTSAYNPHNSRFLIVDGMELFVMDQTTGVETTTGAFVINQPVGQTSGNIIALDASVTIPANSSLVFRRTATQKKADYDGGSVNNTRRTMRSFLQDFYATGLTEAQEDAQSITNNPATNGSDEFDIKVKFGWRGGNAAEHQISFLSNCNNGPLAIGAGEMFENADTVVFMAWGDESNHYMNTLNYTDKTVGITPTTPIDGEAGPLIVSDVQNVQNYIQAAETLAGSNQIWKGIWFNLTGTPSTANLVQATVIGTNASPPANLSSSASAFSGNWTDSDLMPVVNNTAPIKYTAAGYTGDPVQTPTPLTNTNSQSSTLFVGQAATQQNVTANGAYYMSIARNRLVALGFVGI